MYEAAMQAAEVPHVRSTETAEMATAPEPASARERDSRERSRCAEKDKKK